jgi:pimeloyl-ACP methyl ester carboxylesterase
MVMVSFITSATPAPKLSLHNVPLASGVRLHYAAQGPAAGPAVVLLHGYSDSWFSWSRVLPLMRGDLRVVAPDMRGHGDSERPADGYDVADFAGDVIGLLDALAIDRAVVVGHSFGSFVARKVLERAPERVSRLVLTGAGPSGRNSVLLELLAAVNQLTDPVDEGFVRSFQTEMINVPIPADFLETVIATSRRMPSRVWKSALQGLVDCEISLGRPQLRTLVVGGRLDVVFSASEQATVARLFPNGELHLIDGVGHTLHWEQPETFVSALTRFGV